MKRRISRMMMTLVLLLAMALSPGGGFAALVRAVAEGNTRAEYIDNNGNTQVRNDARVVSSSTGVLDGGWWAVADNVTMGHRLEIRGDTHLILNNGTTFTANAGIHINWGAKLTIWGNSRDRNAAGKLKATGPQYSAGIGGNKDLSGGALVIYGGDIDAKGGDRGAGIGGGWGSSMGSVTIYNGWINATGADHGAGIGSGDDAYGFPVTIHGGVITAQGGMSGAGIGGGWGSRSGGIWIKGGNVNARGGANAAGIGGGRKGFADGITIDGGNVNATAGVSGAGIGGGFKGDSTQIWINGGTVVAKALANPQYMGDTNDGYSGAAIGSGTMGDFKSDMIVTGGKVTAIGATGGAGIGAGAKGNMTGRLIVRGGEVYAYGGRSAKVGAEENRGAAGIGGGEEIFTDNGGEGGTVIIEGGKVVVCGGGGWRCAIGHGYNDSVMGTLSIAEDMWTRWTNTVTLGERQSDHTFSAPTVKESDLTPSTVDNRGVDCHNMRYAVIEKCPHQVRGADAGKVYTDISPQLHLFQSGCPYCKDVKPGEAQAHDFTSGAAENTCVCGHKQHTVTHWEDEEGTKIYRQALYSDGRTVLAVSDPDRKGYIFEGWYEKDGDKLADKPYNLNEPVSRDINLYPRFTEAVKKYAVKFLDTAGKEIASRQVESGERVQDVPKPADQGDTVFDGWFEKDTAGKFAEHAYDFSQPVTRDVTLYEKRSPKVVEYTVTFHPENGGNIIRQTVASGAYVKRPDDPTRPGYDFAGWYRKEGNTYFVDPFNFASTITSDVNLYAEWKDAVYTVYFDPAGGKLANPNVTSRTVTSGRTFAQPDAPTWEGHTFVGWQLNGAPYDFSKPVTRNITLKAAWTWNVTVTFDSDGGSAVPSQTVKGGDKIKRPTDPTRTGATFAGWYLEDFAPDLEDEDAGDLSDFYDILWDFDNDAVIEDLTLTAWWEPNEYTVSYDLGYGGGKDTPERESVTHGDTAERPKDPVREGYAFMGWRTASGSLFDFSQPVTGDVALTAQWERNTFTVTFDTNGGNKIEDQTVARGKTATKPADPKRTGYRFTGWHLDGAVYGFDTPVTGDILLEAQWSRPASVIAIHRTYDGTEKPLVSVSGESIGGEMQFALTTEDTAPTSASAYSASIPTATDAGTYYVWYKVEGDTEAARVAVNIAKAELTEAELERTILVYTGEEIVVPVSEVEADSLTVPQNAYTVSGNKATNEGRYTVTVSALEDSNYIGTVTADFHIVKEGTKLFEVSLPEDEYTYTGAEIRPPVVVIDVGTGNELGAENYVLTYANNTNVTRGARVQVSGRNNYRTLSGGTAIPTAVAVFTIHEAPASIKAAPTAKSLTYTGDAQELLDAGSAEGGTMTYSLDGKTYSTAIPVATEANTYTVYYKVVGDANHYDAEPQTVTVTIEKANATATAPTPRNLTYTGQAQALVIAGKSVGGTMTYSLDGKTYSTAIPVATEANTYTVYYKVVGDANHYDTEPKTVTATIAKADATVVVPTPRALTYTGQAQALVNPGTTTGGTMMYSLDGKTYSEDIPTATDASNYTVWYRVEGDGNHADTEAASVNVTISRAELTEVALERKILVHTGKELTAAVVEVNADRLLVPQTAYTVSGNRATDEGRYTVKVTALENSNYTGTASVDFHIVKQGMKLFEVSLPEDAFMYTGDEIRPGVTVIDMETGDPLGSEDYSLTYSNNTNVTRSARVQVTGRNDYRTMSGGKAVRTVVEIFTIYEAPAVVRTAPKAVKGLIYNGSARELIIAGSAVGGTMQYSLDGTNYSPAIPTGIAAGTYTVYYKVVGDANHSDTEPRTVTTTIAKANPVVTAPTARTLTYTGKAQALVTAGTATGGAMWYSLDGEIYSTSLPTGVDADTYTVHYKVIGDANHNDTEPEILRATIARANATVTAPTARTLTYTGKAQALVLAGAANGGAMQYSLDGANYSVDIPTGIDAGDYTVWYRVAGDGNHADTEAASVSVTVARAELTEVKLERTMLVYKDGAELNAAVSEVKAGRLSVPQTAYTVSGDRATTEGDYTVTVTARENSNYTGTVTADYHIAAAGTKLFEAYLTEDEFMYTGEAICPEVIVIDAETGDPLFAEDYGLTYIDNINVTDKAQVQVIGEDDYETMPMVVETFTIYKAPAAVNPAPEAIKDLQYDGSEQALITAGTAVGGTMQYSLNGTNYDSAIPTATGAGTYTVYYKVVGDTNHTDTEPGTVTATIARANTTAAAPKARSLTYTGEAQALVEVSGDSAMRYSLDGTAYSEDIPTGTEARTYTVYYKAVGDDNHSDTETGTVEVTIAKAAIHPTVSITGWIEGENANAPSVSDNPGNGRVTYTYAAKGSGDYAATIPTEAGNYTVKARIAETANYLGGESTAEFVIQESKSEPNQVVWNLEDLKDINLRTDEVFSLDGVTLESLNGAVDFKDNGAIFAGYGFSNDSFRFQTGMPFVSIEITGVVHDLNWPGAKKTANGVLWTGNATTVDFGKHIDQITRIVFTIGDEMPDDTPAISRNLLPEPDFVTPSALKKVGAEAFAKINATHVCIGERTEILGSKAFAHCPNLRSIYIPESVTQIAADLLTGCENVTVYGESSVAEDFAIKNGFEYVEVE